MLYETQGHFLYCGDIFPSLIRNLAGFYGFYNFTEMFSMKGHSPLSFFFPKCQIPRFKEKKKARPTIQSFIFIK